MIRNQWYAVLESKEIKGNKIHCVKRLGQKMIFWRNIDGKVQCIADRCCHRGASLGCGKLVDDHVQCPFHGFEFNGDGKVVYIPANGKRATVSDHYAVESYMVEEGHGFVWLWWGDKDKATYPIPFFEALDDTFTYSTFRDHWATHYSRCIENQLDCVHIPFVHSTTIGKGNKTIVDGPKTVRKGSLLTFYVHNVVDDGERVAQGEESIGVDEKASRLEFLYPNIWHNVIADKVSVFAAFAPIDEENTMIYLRFYQKFLNVPVMTSVVNWLGKQFSKIVLRQDKRVVVTQIPLESAFVMDEKLIPGDAPIIAYRQYRDELKQMND